MAGDDAQGRIARVEFTGRRVELFGLLFRGYVLTVPTIGIYRFWVTTWKRRFYWHNTVIDGEPLEYSGHALQLLIGFLFAIAFFLPIYLAFLYLSTQTAEIVVIGYVAIVIAVWFLTGYAIYRGRDFRLSRTLWRGIRFNQDGSAWIYALRRFAWSLAMVLTLGLIYPAMASSLWRYRYRHTWYGDRAFRWTGTWKTIAGPYYLTYFLIVIAAITGSAIAAAAPMLTIDGMTVPGPEAWLGIAATALFAVLCWFFYRAGEASRMYSEVRLGEARATVKVSGWALFAQFVMFVFSFVAAAVILIVIGLFLLAALSGAFPGSESTLLAELSRLARSGWLTVLALVFGWLLILGTFTLLAETFLGYGYWMLIARGSTISNADGISSVGARDEDQALAGEGLADALNVGAY